MANAIAAETELLPEYVGLVAYLKILNCPYRKGRRLLGRRFIVPHATCDGRPIFKVDRQNIAIARSIVGNAL
jgi:hypothetical protein